MAELSDFDVATGQRFLFNGQTLSTSFFSGGRNPNRIAVLQVSALGGYNSDSAGLNIRVRLNGTSLGQFSVSRWISHSFLVIGTYQLNFSSNLLRVSGSNALLFEPQYAGSSDYCWIGPAIVHFRQNS